MFCCFSAYSQKTNKFQVWEDSLISLRNEVMNEPNETTRLELNEEFMTTLEYVLQMPYSFKHPWDSVKNFAVLNSPDGLFKIFTWYVVKKDYSIENFGFIQVYNEQRKKYVGIILGKGGNFISCVSDYAIINPTAKIGCGSFVGAYAIISADVKIEDFSVIHPFCNIGHDNKIGKYCEIESYVAIGGYSNIGECVTIHPHSTILPRVQVANHAMVGAGSVVIKNVQEGASVFGVPAKRIEI